MEKHLSSPGREGEWHTLKVSVPRPGRTSLMLEMGTEKKREKRRKKVIAFDIRTAYY